MAAMVHPFRMSNFAKRYGKLGGRYLSKIKRPELSTCQIGTNWPYHTLSGWEQNGLVESGRRRIVIRDPHRLFPLAEGRSKS